jgi:Ca2+-binding RTX toxin-like protein
VYKADPGSLPSQIVAQDNFTYSVSDGHGGVANSTLSLLVFNPSTYYQSGANTTLVSNGVQPNVLDGSAGHDVLVGGIYADVLVGGSGDKLTGGSGPDNFLFRPNFGANTITDFDVKNDAIQFDKSIFAGVADVLKHTADSAQGAIISDAHGDMITLTGVTLAQLQAHQSDFHLV